MAAPIYFDAQYENGFKEFENFVNIKVSSSSRQAPLFEVNIEFELKPLLRTTIKVDCRGA